MFAGEQFTLLFVETNVYRSIVPRQPAQEHLVQPEPLSGLTSQGPASRCFAWLIWEEVFFEDTSNKVVNLACQSEVQLLVISHR